LSFSSRLSFFALFAALLFAVAFFLRYAGNSLSYNEIHNLLPAFTRHTRPATKNPGGAPAGLLTVDAFLEEIGWQRRDLLTVAFINIFPLFHSVGLHNW
jgi:hypothetical protein